MANSRFDAAAAAKSDEVEWTNKMKGKWKR